MDTPAIQKSDLLIALAGAALALFVAVLSPREPARPESGSRDLDEIILSGELRAAVMESSMTYFRFKGLERGFQWRKCQTMADSLGVRLRLISCGSLEEMAGLVSKGKADLIISEIPITQDQDSLLFCGQIEYQPLVLLEKGRRGMKQVRDLSDLRQDTLRVAYRWQERYLRSAGVDMAILCMEREDSLHTARIQEEDLVKDLNLGAFKLMATTEKMALYSLSFYPAIRMEMALGPANRFSWAVSNSSPDLAAYINHFSATSLSKESEKVRMANTRRLYETSRTNGTELIRSIRDGVVSDYDSIFRQEAALTGLDWRLLAAIAYTESGFDSTVVSRRGAVGLMQVMPQTLHRYTGKEVSQAGTADIIRAAALILKDNMRTLARVPQKEERLKFALAAYNSGMGHVRDAQALAEKYGKDRLVWEGNVEDFIRLKSQELFYRDSLSTSGYLNGEETCSFVRDVMSRYRQLSSKIPE